MGIGAFAYYRRVVENQKNSLIDEILRVSRHIGVKEESLKAIEAAKSENQFTRSIEMIKDAIPDVLKIKGRNPLTLLHGPLSRGIHELSDDECLELATSIRVVLFDLAEKIAFAMKDAGEINAAVSRLLKD